MADNATNISQWQRPLSRQELRPRNFEQSQYYFHDLVERSVLSTALLLFLLKNLPDKINTPQDPTIPQLPVKSPPA